MAMADGVGFEPTEACTSPVFKTGALNRSATHPALISLAFLVSITLQFGRLLPFCYRRRFYALGFTALRIAASTCSAASACMPGMT